MNAANTIYSVEVVKELPNEELYQRLFECWNITNDKIEVWGELEINAQGNWAGVKKARSILDNNNIQYPLEKNRDLQSGVFLSLDEAKKILGEDKTAFVKCELQLATMAQRKRRNNPFFLAVKPLSVERLVTIPFLDKTTIMEGDISNYITEAVYNLQLGIISDRVKEAQEKVESDLKILESNYDQSTDKLEKLTKRNDRLSTSNTQLKSDISIRETELTALTSQYKKEEQEMVKKIEKLKSYISEKALFLKSFEFIDEDDFDSFIFNVAKERDSKDMLSFSDALNGDYKQAVSYIQAHLKEKDILYPRHIIENYLTLIRSNDLIILAGDSGSGKTNLVQSFAQAVGGVSKIIPVKPNWTSSEDLLGYYNPLEKKYLATPFLEALIEAQQHPEVPYFICLDEMNLARVEYYFADFLSKLESRDTIPEVQLYSDDESAHVLSELKAVVSIISDAKDKYSQAGLVDFVKLMQDEDINAEMKRAFGFSDKDSLIKYHGDIRRMLSGVMSTPSTIKVPANVRIIGAINIDETTHYLSPKILDRAHIMKFKSPLLTDWDEIFGEIENYGFDDVSKPLHLTVPEIGERSAYPKFQRDNLFCELFIDLNREFFNPMGVEFGMRTIRQGLNYLSLFSDVNENYEQAINNFIIHKVLPKFTFDGNKQTGNNNKLDLLDKVLLPRFETILAGHNAKSEEFSSVASLKSLIENAKANDGVVNYWA